MKNWRSAHCTANSINLKTGGPYRLQFTNGQCTKVMFMFGAADVDIDPTQCVVTPDFTMKDPLSMQNCTVFKGMSKFRLVDCFAVNTRPKAVLALNSSGKRQKKSNPLIAIADDVSREFEEHMQEVETHTFKESEVFVGEARKKRMAETLKVASQRAQESMKRRRTLSLT